jgi:hypothetical protein
MELQKGHNGPWTTCCLKKQVWREPKRKQGDLKLTDVDAIHTCMCIRIGVKCFCSNDWIVWLDHYHIGT